jgi:cobalamin biosynthesis Co2+ chelatase CbiK
MCYNIDLNALCDQSQPSKIEVIVESCDEPIGKENDHLKIEVKRLELEVKQLKRWAKVQHTQDNHRNMVKKLEKGTIAPKLASQ